MRILAASFIFFVLSVFPGLADEPETDQQAEVEITFKEFFAFPVGVRGLEYTEKLKSLDGRRVKIHGYMVRQERPLRGTILLAGIPLQLHESEYGFADDLPPATLYVFLCAEADRNVAFRRGLLELTGTLRIGNRKEADGRISTVRLSLDQPLPPETDLSAEPITGGTHDRR